MGIIFGWIILSFIVAFIGSDRKIGYGGTLLLSLLLSPIIGALFAIASPRKTQMNNNQSQMKTNQSKYKYSKEANRLYNAAKKEYKNGNTNQAIELLEKAVKISPFSVNIPLLLTTCYSKIENKEKAFFYLDKATKNGFSTFNQIYKEKELKFLREQPEFNDFAENGYRYPKTEIESNIPNDSVTQLEKLAQLKEKGLLTEEEFQKEKQKILTP